MKKALTYLFAFTSFMLHGQEPIIYKAPKVIRINNPYKGDLYQYQSLRYNVNTAFLSDFVQQITEDAYGRIWFVGSSLGLGCLDGDKVYHYGSHIGIFDRQTRICADKKGGVWVGGNGCGVYHLSVPGVAFHYTRSPLFSPDTIKHDISDVHIRDIFCDINGDMWVATSFNGFTKFSGDSIEFIPINSNPELSTVRSPISDKNGVVWFINNDSLKYLKDNVIHHYILPEAIAKPKELSVANQDFVLLSDGKTLYYVYPDSIKQFGNNSLPYLLIGTLNSKNELFVRNNEHVYKVEEGDELVEIFSFNEKNIINDFLIDKNDNFWLATREGGLICLPDFSIKRFTNARTLWIGNDCLILQKNASIYEVFIANDGKEKHKKHLDLLPDEKVISCYPSGEGVYYFTSNRTIFYNNQTQTISPTNKLIYSKTLTRNYKEVCMFNDVGKTITISGASGDLISFDFAAEERSNLIHISEDSSFYFLCGLHTTDATIIKVKSDKTVDTLFKKVGGDSIKITGAYFVSDHHMMLTSWGEGLIQLKKNQKPEFNVEDVSCNILWGNIIDHADNFWSGGIEGGITYVDKKTKFIAKLSTVDGLIDGKIKDFSLSSKNNDVFISSKSGFVWLKCNDDITVNSQEDFNKKYTLTTYTWSDGLYGTDFDRSHLTKQGVIYSVNSGNLAQIIFPELKSIEIPTNLHFSKVQTEKDDRENYTHFCWYPGILYKPIEQIKLHYTENLLIDISSLYYEDFQNQTYSYQIDTFGWSAPVYSPNFRIAGLKGGEHKISFRAYSKYGSPSEPISLIVDVEGPIYERKMFWLILSLSVIILFVLIFRWRTYYIRQRSKILEETVKERTAEIEHQKIEIETQHNEIKDSIQYAKRLQDAILPSSEIIQKFLPNHFVLFKPKDVVSGDFYWFENKGERLYFAVADCTGHGVPGALVSVVCSNALNRSLNEFNLTEPAKILDKTRELVIETFSKSNQNVKDGMDIGLVAIEKNKIIFSGANNPVWIVRKNDEIDHTLGAEHIEQGEHYSLIELKGDKQPVGLFNGAVPFKQIELALQKNDTIYLISDGFADQFGGENFSIKKPGGKKLKYKPFKKMLIDLAPVAVNNQHETLNVLFNQWKGSFEQVDDVCVVGFKV